MRSTSGNLPDLGLQRGRVERLDDVLVDAVLLRRSRFGLGFRRDHDERRGGELDRREPRGNRS